VTTRHGAAGRSFCLIVTTRWRPAGDGLDAEMRIEPRGDLGCTLPRLGTRLVLPGRYDQAEWFGLGPGEAYADTRSAARVGRWAASVDDLQTPYVRPQENGNRMETRWLRLRDQPDRSGRGLAVEGAPTFAFSVRRWTSETLAAAAHPADLADTGLLFLNLDVAQHGIGSGSCGPGPLEKYHLRPAPTTFRFRLRELTGTGDDRTQRPGR